MALIGTLGLSESGQPHSDTLFWVCVGLVSSLLALLTAFFAALVHADGVVAFALTALVSAALLSRLPAALAARQQRRLETQMGSILRLLSVRLSFEPFESALVTAARWHGRPHAALRHLAHDVQNGVSTLSALRRLSSRTPSILVKKAAMQLAFCYRHGDAEGLRALADEFSHHQASLVQRFAACTGFASVWFETSAAFLPLLFSAYVVVGSSFLDFTFDPSFPFWVLALALPLLNAALVAFVMLAAPEEG